MVEYGLVAHCRKAVCCWTTRSSSSVGRAWCLYFRVYVRHGQSYAKVALACEGTLRSYDSEELRQSRGFKPRLDHFFSASDRG